ncbi:unnamed protein product [Prorocentrum cordatum]|uniref:Uncharacterized protein n=2 Tax=Prorocentrum cordatum TaxID=2364126 RepID=A0ABN9VFK7_9DINO|nr:unnamed protein product [Polarella glacialis]
MERRGWRGGRTRRGEEEAELDVAAEDRPQMLFWHRVLCGGCPGTARTPQMVAPRWASGPDGTLSTRPTQRSSSCPGSGHNYNRRPERDRSGCSAAPATPTAHLGKPLEGRLELDVREFRRQLLDPGLRRLRVHRNLERRSACERGADEARNRENAKAHRRCCERKAVEVRSTDNSGKL